MHSLLTFLYIYIYIFFSHKVSNQHVHVNEVFLLKQLMTNISVCLHYLETMLINESVSEDVSVMCLGWTRRVSLLHKIDFDVSLLEDVGKHKRARKVLNNSRLVQHSLQLKLSVTYFGETSVFKIVHFVLVPTAFVHHITVRIFRL